LFTWSPSSIDANTSAIPRASTRTPTIWINVRSRKTQSSVSYADANQEKLIHAQLIENATNPKLSRLVRMWSSAR
jgi:hypothetical protein